MSTYVFTSFLCFVLLFSCNKAQNCSERGNLQIDALANKLFMLGAENRSYPTSETDMTQYCNANQNYGNFIKRYSSKCFTGLTKQVTGLYMYSVIKTNRRYCSGQRRQQFMSWTPCGNSAKAGTVRCMKRIVAQQSDIINHDSRIKIPLYCCTVYAIKSCAASEYRKSQCDRASIDGWKLIIDKYTDEVTRLLCGEYTEGSDACKKLLRENPLTQRPTGNLTPLNTIVEVLRSLDE